MGIYIHWIFIGFCNRFASGFKHEMIKAELLLKTNPANSRIENGSKRRLCAKKQIANL